MTEVVGVDGQSLTKNEEVKGKGKETEASTSQPEAEDEQVSRMNGETQAASLVADDNQGAGAAVQTEVVDKEAHRKGKRGPAEDCQRASTRCYGSGRDRRESRKDLVDEVSNRRSQRRSTNRIV